jgi:2-dehydro-3-deoxyphosphooctonate aldolase (KDO 8-P synthase)
MAETKFKIGDIEIGSGRLVIIAGPCVVESQEIAFTTAEHIAKVSEKYNIPFIYKSSYIKANRQSVTSFSTIGIDKALKILAEVKNKFNMPILTDIHKPDEAGMAAEVADCLQIPAFLCRQTELVQAAAKTGLPLEIKKGQFMAPENMGDIAAKAVSAGNNKVMLTERGTTFGYHDLVVDYRSLVIMKKIGFPVIFDCTHSVQRPGAEGDTSGGSPEFIIPLAKAAVAVGVDGLFIETHPDPQNAKSDKNCQLKLDLLEDMISQVLKVWK